MLSPAQQILVATYANGDFSHIKSIDESREVGDTLFLFLMIELDEKEDCDSINEAIRRVDSSMRDLHKVATSLREANNDSAGHRLKAAQSAFEAYAFGEGVQVEAHDGFEVEGMHLSKVAYVRYEDDPPEADTHKVTYHVLFSHDWAISEDYALTTENGDYLGRSGVMDTGDSNAAPANLSI